MKRLAGALVAALILALPAPAAADPVPAWTMAACVEADLTGAQPDTSGNWLVVSGVGTACAPAGSNQGFRIATYLPGQATGTAEGYNVRLFDRAYPGQRPARWFTVAVAPPEPGRYGVCLLAGDNEPAGCAVVTAAATGKELSVMMAPLPVDDPLFAKGVGARPYSGKSGPPLTGGVCSSCF